MSRYKAYGEYKDSGVEWLDKVPLHWFSVPIKYMALEKTSLFLDGDWIESKDISGDEIRYITTGNVGEGVYKEQGVGFISTEKFFELNCTEVFSGDILISRLNAPIGRSCIVPDLQSRVVTSVDNVIFRPDSKFVKEFLVYLFSSGDYFAHTANLARGATMQRISRGLLGNIRVVVPTLLEQQKIANFLDHETAKIDTLIAKQQELIKLLKEKRQAVISHAVTKGLNPNAPMRDSGVEWLGEVPAHWMVSRIKDVTWKIVDGPHFSPKYVDEGYMFISARNIKVDRWSLSDAKFICEKDFLEFNKRIQPEKGDVLLTKGGTTGVARAVDLDFPFQVWVHVAVLKIIKPKVDPHFLAYVLNGTSCYEQSQLSTYGATNNDLGLSRIANIVFALPPFEEQIQLNMALNNECEKFDDLITKSIASIDLMQERRTALISAAVTGKIDVRDWQPAPLPEREDVTA